MSLISLLSRSKLNIVSCSAELGNSFEGAIFLEMPGFVKLELKRKLTLISL